MITYFIDLCGLDGPGGPETTPKGGSPRAQLFEVVSGADGAIEAPTIDDFWLPENMFHDSIYRKLWGYMCIVI